MVLEAPLVAADVVQWLYSDASRLEGTLDVVSELASRLQGGNVPVDRVTTGIWVVHPNVRAEGSIWASDGTRTLRLYVPGPDSDAEYENSRSSAYMRPSAPYGSTLLLP